MPRREAKLADLPSRLDLQALGRDYWRQNAKKVDPSIVDVDGSDANLFVGSSSVVADAVVKQIGFNVNRLTLAGAEDEDLDRYAWDRYQLTRKGASPALGTVRIFRAAATAGSGSVPVNTSLKTISGAEYITTSVANFGPSDLSTLANVRAAQAGKSSQVGKNAIRKFSQPSLLFDATLQVTNDDVTAGGEDTEDDETFKNRIQKFWTTARRGTLGAIEFGAISVPGVVSAQAIEALSGSGLPARVVNLYIADSSGVASQALADQVIAALDDYRAGGIAVVISTSIPLIVSIQLALSFEAGVDTVTLTQQIQAAIVEYVNSLPVNGTLLVAGLFSVLQQFFSDGVVAQQSSIVAPVGDLVPAIGQTIRTTTASVQVVAA